MLTNTCAACGASDAKKDCGRCKTTYCSAACPTQHWKEGGHKDLCRRIKRGGGAEQYHADKKYAEAAVEAVETCAEVTKGQICYICRDERSTEGLVRGCACHTTEGFAHLSCLVQEARVVSEDQFRQHDPNSIWRKWAECGLCHQMYHGAVARAMAWGGWKTYLSRPDGDAVRGYTLNIVAVALNAGTNNNGEEALCAATAYRDWTVRFDQGSLITAEGNLAFLYAQLDRHDEAIPLMKKIRVFKLRCSRGSENISTIQSGLNLSMSLIESGRHGEAIELLRDVRPAAHQALGEDHRICISLTLNLGLAHLKRGADTGDLLAAGAIFRECVLRCRKVFGPEHPLTDDTEKNFVVTLEDLEASGCDAGVLKKLRSGVLKDEPGQAYEPRSRPGPWRGPEPAK